MRLGYTRRQTLRLIRPLPARRGPDAYSWCVKRSRGRVTAAFSSRSARGRALLVIGTASRDGTRAVHPGAPLDRVLRRFRTARRLAGGIYRAGPRSQRIFGVRRGRVRFVGVADRRLLRNRRTLRRYLRRAGV